jgi:hypothetical protein
VRQAFLVAVTSVIEAGEHGRQLMPNMVVDALARIWSPAYQRITRAEGSARRLIEMRPADIRTVWRELALRRRSDP